MKIKLHGLKCLALLCASGLLIGSASFFTMTRSDGVSSRISFARAATPGMYRAAQACAIKAD